MHKVDDERQTKPNRCRCERRPPIPKRTDPVPRPYPPYQNDYIEFNAKHASDAANYHHDSNKMQVIDSRDGHLVNLDKSGLVPQYITKPVNYTNLSYVLIFTLCVHLIKQGFGRLPSYLKKEQKQQQSQPLETPKSEGTAPISSRKTEQSDERLQPSHQISTKKEIQVGQ